MHKVFRDDKGAALTTAVLLTLVLIIVGGGLWQLSTNEGRQAVRDQQSRQAYYIARSGVEAVAAYMIENPESGEDLIGSTSDEVHFGVGSFTVEIVEDGENHVLLISTGTVANTDHVVRVRLRRDSGFANVDLLPFAVYSKERISMEGSAEIHGDSGTPFVVNPSVVLTGYPQLRGDLYIAPGANPNTSVQIPWGSIGTFIHGTVGNLADEVEYMLPDFPQFPEGLIDRGSMVIEGGPCQEAIISSDGYYSELILASDRTLTINVGTGDRVLRIGRLDLRQGHVRLMGSGRLILYVEDYFNIAGSSTVNANGSTGDVIMYYKGEGVMDPAGATKFVGSVYAERASIHISGSGGISGDIAIGGPSVIISGDAEAHVRALYAPNSSVALLGSGRVRGVLVAHSVHMAGNTRVFYSDDIDDVFGLIALGGAGGFQMDLWL